MFKKPTHIYHLLDSFDTFTIQSHLIFKPLNCYYLLITSIPLYLPLDIEPYNNLKHCKILMVNSPQTSSSFKFSSTWLWYSNSHQSLIPMIMYLVLSLLKMASTRKSLVQTMNFLLVNGTFLAPFLAHLINFFTLFRSSDHSYLLPPH